MRERERAKSKKIEPISIRPWIRCYLKRRKIRRFYSVCCVFSLSVSLFLIRYSFFFIVAFHRHLTIVSNIWPIVWQPNHVGLSSTINCLRDNNNFFSLCDVGSIVGIIMYFFHLLDFNWNIFSKSTSEKKRNPIVWWLFLSMELYTYIHFVARVDFFHSYLIAMYMHAAHVVPFNPWQKISLRRREKKIKNTISVKSNISLWISTDAEENSNK